MSDHLLSESDVEQKLIYSFLTTPEPEGLGYTDFDFRTKADIRKISIDKGGKKKLYYPDYAVIVNGLPAIIIEAKSPGEDLEEALREARLYASEINSSYPTKVNPCEKLVVCNGEELVTSTWDSDTSRKKIKVNEMESINPAFKDIVDFLGKRAILSRTGEILSQIKRNSTYLKPVHMLGGKSIINEVVGENSFGSNVSVEYKYLFNPESTEDRESIVKNAYVDSKRKQSHIAPIDKIIRAAQPKHMTDSRIVSDTQSPHEIISEIERREKITNELCLLIGSVGSGKSTFSDYLRVKALPKELMRTTSWININLNTAPLSRNQIYTWITTKLISLIEESHKDIDTHTLDSLLDIYEPHIDKVKKGRASLFEEGSDKHAEVIYKELERLQGDENLTLECLIDYFFTSKGKLLVIVLDNCDKRSRNDQLLMFEVASWLKNSFSCMVFLPLRDTTYDQYKDHPPLDTVIKDLVFRIDPPLLERVIYKRLSFALREIQDQQSKFYYHLPNGMTVSCSRSEVALYLKSIIFSLFQDNLFKRIVTGLAGRNIRKGLEIFLDFCKSGHISESEILKLRQSNGDYSLPNHLISKILLKGKRRYYSDEQSNIKNLFHSLENDSLPDPFARIAILNWLHSKFREYGPNMTRGFHRVGDLASSLQGFGHSERTVLEELTSLTGC